MRENRLRRIWADGGTVVNGWLSIPSSISAELMAQQDWDSLCIDLQHGAVDYQVMLPMLQAISTTDKVPLVRVPWNEPGIIGKVLDAGVYGVICPMVNSRREAEAFVGACRYPPDGYRSVGPWRGTVYGGADYIQQANRTIVTLAMIETRAAVANLDAILSVPGLDAVYVGPSDLSASMGETPMLDPVYPEVLKTIETIAAAAHRHGVVPCIHTGSVAYATRMIDTGYRLVTYMSDARLLQWIAGRSLKAMRAGVPNPEVP